jgi:hypothetical protein
VKLLKDGNEITEFGRKFSEGMAAEDQQRRKPLKNGNEITELARKLSQINTRDRLLFRDITPGASRFVPFSWTVLQSIDLHHGYYYGQCLHN